jgi:hypothetical protein
MLHKPGIVAAPYEIARLHSSFELERDASCYVAEHVLQCQSDNRRGDSRCGEKARRIRPEPVQQLKQRSNVRGDNHDFAGELRHPDFAQREIEKEQKADLNGCEDQQRSRNLAGQLARGIPMRCRARDYRESGPKYEQPEGGSDARSIPLQRLPKDGGNDKEAGGCPERVGGHGDLILADDFEYRSFHERPAGPNKQPLCASRHPQGKPVSRNCSGSCPSCIDKSTPSKLNCIPRQ